MYKNQAKILQSIFISIVVISSLLPFNTVSQNPAHAFKPYFISEYQGFKSSLKKVQKIISFLFLLKEKATLNNSEDLLK